MLVFIDDSGDPGFKVDKGSTSHFVIACVIFDDDLDAEETALKVKRFRQALGWHQFREFKFNKTARQIRREFLGEVSTCRFRVRAIVVEKALVRSELLRRDKHSFYNYTIKEVLKHSGGSIHEARIRLDGHGDRAYKQAAKTYFRTQLNIRQNVIRDLKFVDSKGDSLIQVADMIAGAILRAARDTKPDSQEYRDIISARIEDVWLFR